MSRVADLAGFVFIATLTVGLAFVTAIGMTYLPAPTHTRERLRGEVLYHYCAQDEVSIDPATRTFIKIRRGRSRQPWMFGRRAIYFYAGYAPRRPKSNHPRLRRVPAAVITVSGHDLLAAIGDAAIWYRRHDRAIAVFADYRGTYRDITRGITLFPRRH